MLESGERLCKAAANSSLILCTPYKPPYGIMQTRPEHSSSAQARPTSKHMSPLASLAHSGVADISHSRFLLSTIFKLALQAYWLQPAFA